MQGNPLPQKKPFPNTEAAIQNYYATTPMTTSGSIFPNVTVSSTTGATYTTASTVG